MKQALIRSLVRWRFRLTSRSGADMLIADELHRYLELASQFTEAEGRQSVQCPPLLGVDEDMREWSLYQILEHNVIVNSAMQSVVTTLAREEIPQSTLDSKHDVMPGASAGPEQVDRFRQSVEAYQQAVEPLKLGSIATYPHPVFRLLNAHGWHCMMGLHLQIHRKQAEAILPLVKAA